MKWRREMDYHGSRLYGSEEVRLGRSALAIAWLGEIVKGKLRKLRGDPRSAVKPLQEVERSFSLPGTTSSSATAGCPFPAKPLAIDPNWRILP